jgi:hypothetical protein
MMKHKYHLDEAIERTLQSLEGIQPAEPSSFFYTRLQARMERKLVKKTGGQWQPVYAYAALVLVLLLNFATLYTLTRTSSHSLSNADSFVNEHGLNDISSLDTN